MSLDIDPQALSDLIAASGDEQITIVNFIRLRSDGADAYAEYGERVAPILRRHGVELLYSGACVTALIGEDEWDFVAVARYPNADAIKDLVDDPEFEACKPLRHKALKAGIVHACR